MGAIDAYNKRTKYTSYSNKLTSKYFTPLFRNFKPQYEIELNTRLYMYGHNEHMEKDSVYLGRVVSIDDPYKNGDQVIRVEWIHSHPDKKGSNVSVFYSKYTRAILEDTISKQNIFLN